MIQDRMMDGVGMMWGMGLAWLLLLVLVVLLIAALIKYLFFDTRGRSLDD